MSYSYISETLTPFNLQGHCLLTKASFCVPKIWYVFHEHNAILGNRVTQYNMLQTWSSPASPPSLPHNEEVERQDVSRTMMTRNTRTTAVLVSGCSSSVWLLTQFVVIMSLSDIARQYWPQEPAELLPLLWITFSQVPNGSGVTLV